MTPSDEQAALEDIKIKIKDIKLLEEEPDFIDDQTLRRYLIAREWNVTEAEKMLRATVEWRRDIQPQKVVCSYCQEQPGYHALRQVGFDNIGRPLFYGCLAQYRTQHFTVDDVEKHVTFLVEQGKRTMSAVVYQFVWIIDITGIKLSACNPTVVLAVEKLLSNHYPERLGGVVIVNHGRMFQGFWNTVKRFMDARTVSKVHIHRSNHKIEELLTQICSDDLKHWIYDEIRLNKEHPMSIKQKEFWKKPSESEHDPRGDKSYVATLLDVIKANTIKMDSNEHQPHPNILQNILGQTTLSSKLHK